MKNKTEPDPLWLGIPAQKMAYIALAAWLCSLALPGISLYAQLSSQRHWLAGFEILLMGWLSPLVGNFAWFANIFFLYGFFKLKSGEVPIKSSVFAALLALDTFRFDQLMLNEGGSTTPVYGFGWGAILWFLSIAILLTATGTYQPAAKEDLDRSQYAWCRSLGIFLTVITIAGSGFFSIYDRIMANSAEAQRLSSIAFKRGKICSAPDPTAKDPIYNFSGTLEIVATPHLYPFHNIKDLLSWGIPTVRFDGNDYSYDSGASSREVISKPTMGEAAAILEFIAAGRIINAKLIETATGRIVFEQKWERERLNENTNFHFCPDYHSFPGANDQPRKLVIQALGLPISEKSDQQVYRPIAANNILSGSITDEADGGTTRKMRYEKWKSEINPFFKADTGIRLVTSTDYHEWFNTNCPSDTGWDGSNRHTQQRTGWAFMAKGKAYYLNNHSDRNYAICVEDVAYLYTGGMRNDNKYYLNISKRTIPDFQQTWAGIILIPNITSTMRDNQLEIQSIKEENGLVNIKLVNEDTGKIIFVQANIESKEPKTQRQ